MTDASLLPAPIENEKPRKYTAADAAFAGVFFLLGYFCCRFCFYGGTFRGLGPLTAILALFGISLLYLRLRRRRISRRSALHLAVILAISSGLLFSDNGFIRLLTVGYALISWLYWYFCACRDGAETHGARDGGMIFFDLLKSVLVMPFSCLGSAFGACGHTLKNSAAGKKILLAAGGLLIAVLPTAAVLRLLISADGAFANLTKQITDSISGEWPVHLLCFLFGLPLAAFLFGALYAGGADLNRDIIEPGGAEGFSTFMGYYLLCAKSKAGDTAGALRDLYDSMGRGTGTTTDENPAIIFDRAAEKVCRGCALCELCWQKEYTGTFNALNDATPFLLERGRVMAKDFPQYFADRCIHLVDFMAAINGELSAFLLRRQYRRQLEETRRSAQGQYAQLSELLTATAVGLGESVPAFVTESTCCVGAVLKPKEGEMVCGDTVVSFQTEEGAWCLLLADGMGSGEEARRESALTCRLVQQFLEAGIHPEAALKTLNAAMALRGAETGSFTTIDLCVFEPQAGEAAFYKYGAAPSYLKKGGTVRRVTGGSLPAGLRGAPASPDVTRVPLEPGSFAVMISDGVADPGRDEWLLNLLAGWEGTDPQVLATLILAESIRQERLQDDCAVQVIYRQETSVKKV